MTGRPGHGVRRVGSTPAPIATPTLVILMTSTLFSCSPTYVLRAAWEEARILLRRRPIAELLNDPSLEPGRRAKLELVVQARSFARRELDLEVGDSYTSFSDIGRDTLSLVLSASPRDRLVAYTWWFPIVGRVPYKGFFSREKAEAARRELESQGYDTYLRTTSAFSTLGWLPDPLLSTVLRQDSVGLVETVIHEVTHNTMFISGHVKFNESFANYVGSVGAIEFFCRPEHDPATCQAARDRWHDTLLFGEFLDGLWDELTALYEARPPGDSLLAARDALLERAADRYRAAYAPRMRLPGYARFDPTGVNNAWMVARHLYYHRLGRFQAVHERFGDLATSIRTLRSAVRDADDPWTAIEGLIASQAQAHVDPKSGVTVPAP